MKKIAIFNYDSSTNPLAAGGASEYNSLLFTNLTRQFEITIYCAGTPGFDQPQEVDGIRYVPISSGRAYANSKLRYWWKVFRTLNRVEADIIIENFFYPFPLLLQFFTRKPVILICHGTYGRHSIRKFGILGVPIYLLEKMYRLTYKYLFTVSPTSYKEFRTRQKLLIPPGLPEYFTNIKYSPKPQSYIAMLTRIDIYQKGLDIVRDLAQRIPAEIRIAGDGHRLPGFKESVTADNIKFVGRKDGREKIAFLQESRFFLMPSRHEGFGISGLEAQACWKPVVGFDIGDLNFCVKNNVSGLLVKPYDSEALLEAILRMLKDDDLLEKLSRGAYAHSQEFSYKKGAEKLSLFIEDIIDGKKI